VANTVAFASRAARMPAVVAAAALLALPSGSLRATQQAPPLPLDVILRNAAAYTDAFSSDASGIVIEETYIQQVRGKQLTTRRMRSDVLITGDRTVGWYEFRDVFEVDGQVIRDRDSRLARLFLKPSESSIEQAHRIQDESSRYNLGNMRRTIDNPVLGIVILQADFQPRFHYSLGKMDPKVGPGVWIIDYKEEAHPSFIRGRSDLDLFAHGRLWIEAETGRLMRTEVLLEQPTLRAKITTSFRFDDRFGITVPYEMQEEYKFDNGIKVTAVATYDRFRRFDVSTEDTLKDEKVKD